MIAVFLLLILASINAEEIPLQDENHNSYSSPHTIVDTSQDNSLPDIIFPRLNNSILSFNQTLSALQQSYQTFIQEMDESDFNDRDRRQNHKKKENALFRNFAQAGFIFYSFNSSQPANLFIHESLILPKNANLISIADRELFDLNHDIAVLKFLVDDVKQRIKAKQRQFRAKLKAAKKSRKGKLNKIQEETFE
ncbi:hypothetical protein BpHYR1_041630 [Brachionus plicatilis]|uniref:Uncharacterized protein n=1 Tax=Brachionus plicatilis TaxID=10195 RepID=A0A3M7ST41_BRAPC|nr:hypothetical protein BpHYR1_041630 [Brachionus plicatilis]